MAKVKRVRKPLVWKNRIYTCEVSGEKILYAYTDSKEDNRTVCGACDPDLAVFTTEI